MLFNLESVRDLNINLTYGVAFAIRKLMKSLMDGKKLEKVDKDENASQAHEEDEVIEFTNNLGVDITLYVEEYLERPEELKINYGRGDIVETFELPNQMAPISFRKSDLINAAKIYSRTAAQSSITLDKFILRMDLMIEGMQVIRGVPIDLTGVRSYDLELADTKSKLLRNFRSLGLVVRTRSKSNGRICQGNFF